MSPEQRRGALERAAGAMPRGPGGGWYRWS